MKSTLIASLIQLYNIQLCNPFIEWLEIGKIKESMILLMMCIVKSSLNVNQSRFFWNQFTARYSQYGIMSRWPLWTATWVILRSLPISFLRVPHWSNWAWRMQARFMNICSSHPNDTWQPISFLAGIVRSFYPLMRDQDAWRMLCLFLLIIICTNNLIIALCEIAKITIVYVKRISIYCKLSIDGGHWQLMTVRFQIS